ncbi:hypothetical protein [Companilactobacillus allii]|uniref:hypothetical protein n=1 Tax=Companilactobacillus allii TaxID=1847728 RepID=UPI000F770557|nr:hypothetical protein [Companilactobacillus allii]
MSITTTFIIDNHIVSAAKLSDPADLNNAINTAPQGLDIKNGAFVVGTFGNNSAKVIDRNKTPDDKTGILQITSAANQLGSIWGDINKDNYIDLNNNQTLSMWLYFGRPVDPSLPAGVGDGMAFVLQNSGIDAISRYTGPKPSHNPSAVNKLGIGESMGVWGTDFNYDHGATSTTSIAKTAIQKSWAMEFDTFLNKATNYDDISGEGFSFDNLQNGQHIGANYPDSPSSYRQQTAYDYHSTGTPLARDYYVLSHDGPGSLSLTDANWHHITYNWNAATETMNYSFNDKKLDGTHINDAYTGSYQIDPSHFKLSDNKLRWGFTGSTGKYFENNLVVFESIPSFVSADSSVSIKDNTLDKVLSTSDNYVDAGDDLSFIYNLNFESGSKEWENILASMNLPSQVSFESASIKYGDDPNVEVIPASEFSNSSVQHLLQRNLSNSNKQATIEIHTKVKPVTSAVSVPKSHASFKGDNFIIDDDAQAFNIRYKDISTLNLSTDVEGTINYDNLMSAPETTVINGLVKNSTGKVIDNSTTDVHTELNGVKQSYKLNGQNPGEFVVNVKRSDLIAGKNTLTIYAEDVSGKKSNEIKIIFDIGGGLTFGVVNDVSFKTINQGLKDQLVQRQSGWRVEVVDGRTPGQSWDLQAKADNLYSDNDTKLNGNLVFKDEDGNLSSLIDYQSVKTHIKNITDVQTIDVAGLWTKNAGILLQMNEVNPSGKYTGKIHWNLIDSVH